MKRPVVPLLGALDLADIGLRPDPQAVDGVGEQRARAVSVWAAVAGAAGVLGLLASGILLQSWSWSSVFWFNGALVGAAVVGTVVFVPESAERGAPRLDVIVAGGRPIGQSIAWAGPFVMNTKAEVLQAYEDFQRGSFGHIPG